MIKSRNRFFSLIHNNREEAVLVMDSANVRYVTGLELANSCIVFFDGSVQIFTDILGYPLLRDLGSGFDIHCSGLSAWVETLNWLKKNRVRRCRQDPMKMPLAFSDAARSLAPQIEWVDSGDQIAKIRMVKTRQELDRIKDAVTASEVALEEWISTLKDGITEKAAIASLNQFLIRSTGELPLFPSMVAFGINSAYPHWCGSSRRLSSGDTILVDCGARVEGYGADLSRTFFWKKYSACQLRRYRIVLNTLKSVVTALQPGLRACTLDDLARKTINSFGMGDYFVHPLGHGVGLEVHEPPYFSLDSQDEIVVNMVVALEPGLFVPGWGGVRLEETICVLSSGASSMAEHPVSDRPVL